MLFPLNEHQELTEKKQTLVYETNQNFDFLGGKIL
jgi:lactoylglutathione lyase